MRAMDDVYLRSKLLGNIMVQKRRNRQRELYDWRKIVDRDEEKW